MKAPKKHADSRTVKSTRSEGKAAGNPASKTARKSKHGRAIDIRASGGSAATRHLGAKSGAIKPPASAKSGRRNPSLQALGPVAGVAALSTEALSEGARRAAEALLDEGESDNTARSYQSAMRYWCAWFQLRFGQALTLPLSVPVVTTFITDHAQRMDKGRLTYGLGESDTQAIDERLVAAGFKGRRGPLKLSTIEHRLYVLSKVHQLKAKAAANPCEDARVRLLLSRAKKAATKRGEVPLQKSALTREPLDALLATCDDTLTGVRDRALLLFAWTSGGRRRSEVANARIEQLEQRSVDLYLFHLHHSKTNQTGAKKAGQPKGKPIRGSAAIALTAWLDRAQITEGPLFRRVWGNRVGESLSGYSIARIVQNRARKAGLKGDWAAHSLRSGFVTEAGRRNLPFPEVMAMTGHMKVDTALGYYRTGELGESEVAGMFDEGGQ